MTGAAFAPWQQRIYDQAAAAFDGGRLGHALLFCGPAQLGKRAVAERLAQRVLCQARAAGDEPCGTCRSCTLYLSRSQGDPMELRPDGTPAHPSGKPGHPDVWFVGYALNEKSGKPRTEIVIEQIRELSQKLSLTPQLGTAQVAIVEPADAINHAACNALLKTLEEPRPGRHLWLVSADPARLPATIRSRCQKLEFRLPPHAEALAWLHAQGHDAAAAAEALAAARGHPGLADAWLRDGSLALRREVADDLARLARGQASAAATAQRWVADEQAALRLRFATDLALHEATGLATALRLTDVGRTRRLAAWFDAANRTRALLRTTVRAELAVAELLLAWQAAGERGRMSGEQN
ncbi:DNA polymerase III subunit delta' [Cognatiluteimonas weifangensis]|uniref:DNA-directed DNA polymerase n=1 Tax=Cognatiluteimonas weifangensis TaxID=2303539 RepID=A0A372DKC0_9GAMM|nr:DNA polymerase III subunit delta' [Luteimonas weifangensis]RFP59976.1 DNA polymerase III subunit delta' [Luteimonas weifangensis]